MDYVKVHTRSLLQPSQATALHASHNSFSASTNLWNDLAKAMKASAEKKREGQLFIRPEPWTGLCCSEPYWRSPVGVPVGQPGALVCSKVCQHGSFGCGCDAVTLQHVYSEGEWFVDWMLLLTSAAPPAMHYGFFGDDDTLESPEQFCNGFIFTNFATISLF